MANITMAATAPMDVEEIKVMELFQGELQLVETLMYRNKNQHGRARYFRKLQVREMCIFNHVVIA